MQPSSGGAARARLELAHPHAAPYIADDLLIDLLFSANGETYASIQSHVRELLIEDTPVRVLDIDGLLRTKTDYREIDLLDKQVLSRIRAELKRD